MTYTPPKRPLGYTYDEHGNVLSCRYTCGVGWDCTRDEHGNVLSIRRTDGTGYDVIARSEYDLMRHTDGKYEAGCRGPFPAAEALAHWDREDERACIFTIAIALAEAME